MELAGATVVVTGGASGMGAATAAHLAKAGAHVVIIDQDEGRGTEVASAVGGRFVAGDVSSAADMEAAFAEIAEASGPLRVLVHCAGTGLARKVVSRRGAHDLESFERVVRVNVIGAFNCIRLAAWHMSQGEASVDDERGVIIVISSIASSDGTDGGVAYSASKGAIAGMTLPLARDLGPLGVRVVEVAPGWIDTPRLEGRPLEFRNAMLAATPFPGRFGQPEEFAFLAEHIVANRFLNGCAIRLDGGIRMAPSQPFR